jgi:hypothetical protein
MRERLNSPVRLPRTPRDFERSFSLRLLQLSPIQKEVPNFPFLSRLAGIARDAFQGVRCDSCRVRFLRGE